MKKTIVTILSTTALTVAVTTGVVYKSISISEPAYKKVVADATQNKISYRDAASKMIMAYKAQTAHMTLSPDNGAPFLVDFGRDVVNGQLRNDIVHVRLEDRCIINYMGTTTDGITGYEHYDFVCEPQ